MATPNLRYMVSGGGWAVSVPISMLIPPSTIVDTSQPAWSALAGKAPVDAIALDQATMDFMTSYGASAVGGLGYDPNRVRAGPGVTSRALDQYGPDWWLRPNHSPGPWWI
jgi:hypothetical protein